MSVISAVYMVVMVMDNNNMVATEIIQQKQGWLQG